MTDAPLTYPDAEPLDPEDVAACLRVLGRVHEFPEDHPDFVAVRRATGKMFKAVKKYRRDIARSSVRDHDREILEATATASPERIDDETRGSQLTSRATTRVAGHLKVARGCYICKEPYTQVDSFYHALCPACADFSHGKREARTDLSGRRALLTGGRAKIGMHIALRLLRDGAHTTITTRFPNDAARRYAQMPDAADWLHRLDIVGIDLRDPAQVIALTDRLSAEGPLDIIINNAAQTVRRSAGAYSAIIAQEDQALPAELPAAGGGTLPAPRTTTLGRAHERHPIGVAGQLASPDSHAVLGAAPVLPVDVARAGIEMGHASLERHEAGTAIDAGGLIPDTATSNSWTQTVSQVDALELLEVQLCNVTAPFLIVSRLRGALKASPRARTYVVNVSAMEGQFGGRRYKGAGHPHTNMAKASLNMLTRTSAQEMFESDGILMTSVDTGWITDERPHEDKLRMAREGWSAPLDLVDGAARVYDPIVRGEAGEDLYGVFLKDYKPVPW
ncbi:SDR family NAD(P)-dependent oxidoreductase [Falsarthrobacter nasiphocae]|uniref:NAD(P)-dependent dehydrogenase (Short-subunit alcohol dehydrogenase family) n=1 Tax=Falsarthrobacter nasiphocae TaxID=189863 RepID=A0AAE3YFA3_9MICC|nr:SDR family NAD(P)-dependent oxidoreductase [Falsarthrobacter nasiphocae]MDR6891125.1 NAD(P)-dependent dehydrogenase (short-subunit alcohol dehydrogenase family) [Falsarthrobacter nasiphocae]